MPRIVESTFLAHPIERVFAFVGDAANNAAWHAHVEGTTWLDDGPMRVGRQGLQISRIFGRTWAITAEIVEWHPPNAVAWRVVQGPSLRTSIRLAPEDGGTRLTLALEAGPTLRGPLGRLLDRAAGRLARSQGEADLARLRAALKAEP